MISEFFAFYEVKLISFFFVDVDLYKLYRVVDRLGGHTRVTNKNLWKQVGRKLGFENTWSINQVCFIHLKFAILSGLNLQIMTNYCQIDL